jgi:hypothetical protein
VPVQGSNLGRAAPKVKGQPMAKDDSIAHGCAGQVFFDKDCQERLGTFSLSKASLQKLEHTLNTSLDAVQKARGKRIDTVQRLCNLVGITKRDLAMGIILERNGDISQVEMAKILNINVDTFRKPNWSNVRNSLNTIKA